MTKMIQCNDHTANKSLDSDSNFLEDVQHRHVKCKRYIRPALMRSGAECATNEH